MDNLEIFDFLGRCTEQDGSAILVTLVNSIGPSMRQVGGHMAVSAQGDYVGALSAGCIEAAIVAEALDALEAMQPRTVRFGQGSAYIDIRLPCGGGIDLHFQPVSDPAIARQALHAIKARQPFGLMLPKDIGKATIADGEAERGVCDAQDHYRVNHLPNPKVMIIGEGAAISAMAALSAAARVEIEILSPDGNTIERAKAGGIPATPLQTIRDTDAILSDPWTAMLFLFHDHEWERHLLPKALREPHFYIGAMGSKAVHQRRREMLHKEGFSASQIAAVHAPIGLIPSARDPHTLAISALAEIIEEYHRSAATGVSNSTASVNLQLAG